jgi:ABC-type enterobactin transport system permease subunit
VGSENSDAVRLTGMVEAIVVCDQDCVSISVASVVGTADVVSSLLVVFWSTSTAGF